MDSETNRAAETSATDLILDLNFVPAWARKPPESAGHPREISVEETERPRQTRRRPPRGTPGPVREPARARPLSTPEKPATPSSARPSVDVEVFFIPDRRPLGVVVHRIRATRRAYPLYDLARLLLSHSEYHHVKLECRVQNPAERPLHQCTVCGQTFLARDTAVEHILDRHLDHWFEARQEVTEPPTGQFPCVMRSPKGRLIGPPNHHTFAENLKRAHEEEAPDLPLEDYRSRLEAVRETEIIEQWRREASTVVRYHRRDQPDSPPLSWSDARAWVRTQGVPTALRDGVRAILSPGVALELEDGLLRERVREAWAREQRFPTTMMMALRPALRHMGLHLFKDPASHTFVAAVAPEPLDPEHAIPPIRNALLYLLAHPGCTREQMVADLFAGRGPHDPEVVALLGHLRWLVEKGHVIEFHNGVLAVPRRRHPAVAPEAAEPSPRAAPRVME